MTANVYNDSEATIKVKEDIRSYYAKVCFLARKDKQCDCEPSPFGLFTDLNHAFFTHSRVLPFHILQQVKSLPVFIPEA